MGNNKHPQQASKGNLVAELTKVYEKKIAQLKSSVAEFRENTGIDLLCPEKSREKWNILQRLVQISAMPDRLPTVLVQLADFSRHLRCSLAKSKLLQVLLGIENMELEMPRGEKNTD